MLTSMCSALIDTPASPQQPAAQEDVLVKANLEYVPAEPADASVDVSSVITQYLGPTQAATKWQQAANSGQQQDQQLTKDQLQVQLQQPQQLQQQQLAPPQPGSRSWRHRLRHLLCCVAPPPQGPSGCSAADLQLVNTLYQLPPQPPRVYREAVIGPKAPQDVHKKTLVLDLDETLVHSSFKPIPNPDYIIPVEIDGRLVDVYVLKRPWLDHFLNAVGPRFEVVVFTASLAKYADPLLDLMDKGGLVRWRLFRESCCPYEGNYVKDLNCLGRQLADTIIVDNSPHSYVFQPSNAVPISTFIDDMEDTELLEVLPQLLAVADVDDVRHYLGANLARSKALCLR